MKRSTLHPAIIAVLLVLMAPTVVLGQNASEACQAFINGAFSDVGTNCAGLGAGEACFGFGTVDGGDFAQEGDQAGLSTFDSISGSPFVAPSGAEDGEWGIAVANAQTNLPATAGAVYMLFGDATVTEAGSSIYELGSTVDVTVDGASLFNKPAGFTFDGAASTAVDTVSGTLTADAVSEDGAFVRVASSYETTYGDSATGWLQTSDLSGGEDLSSLPVVGPDSSTAMQNFTFEASPSLPGCENALPNGLFIQGAETTETDFTINGVNARLTSAAYASQLNANEVSIVVLSGVLILNPGASNEVVVAAGEEVVIGAGGNVRGPFVVGNSGSSVTESTLFRLSSLTDVSGNLFNYTPATITLVRASGVGVPELTIVISPADQAQRISNFCDTNVLTSDVCEFLQ